LERSPKSCRSALALLGYIAKMEEDAEWSSSIEELRERAELLERIATAEA
jgi:hypothetical protein